MAKTKAVSDDASLIKELEAFLARPVPEGTNRTIEEKVATLHAFDLLAILKPAEVPSEDATTGVTAD